MKKNRIVIALVLALILAASAALPAFAEGEYKYHITIPGKGGSLCNSPTYVAYEKGFFAEEGIDVELITSDFEPSKIGLNNGTISTVNGDFQFFPAIQEGIGMSIVDGLHQGCIKVEVLPESEISGVEDLRGKRVGVGAVRAALLRSFLRSRILPGFCCLFCFYRFRHPRNSRHIGSILRGVNNLCRVGRTEVCCQGDGKG